MKRAIFEQDHNEFRDQFRKFLEKEIAPHREEWLKNGIVSRDAWLKAGAAGYCAPFVDEEYGGLGLKYFRYAQIMIEELSRIRESGFALSLHNDVIAPYIASFASEEQKKKYLPKIVSGECILAVAMTEPGTGSDLQNIKTRLEDKGDHYILNGAKTFISNGILADLVIVAAKCGEQGITLALVERGMEGFERGRKLEKMGMHSQDTAELFFNNVIVPKENILGQVGMGFIYLMQKLAQERLVCAVGAIAGTQFAIDWTVEYTKGRVAFGKPLSKQQNTRFKLAELQTEATIGQLFVDDCVMKLNANELTPDVACMAKYWTTDLLNKTCYECGQLHGGYGYMMEYPIAQAYLDARITTIFAGANEIMKEVVARAMGL
ncbi:MAG TPA: acyl-CoA dehydrogenase family protein [Pseudomonadales bacterium]|nr:acyl-CoA dehydrogenase family protein [Pseudomonadales bacterium]